MSDVKSEIRNLQSDIGLPPADVRRRVRRRLAVWFQRERRDLPWRHDRDPYHIWISEVMLQQTQVATVVPYFQRFLQAFPTLTDLAAADEQKVLRLWEGLGYYRRARHLHQAARHLTAHHGGELPNDPGVVGRLPGVGRYILGAVLSQAFDARLPIVEANSERVLCRLFGLRGDPRRNPSRRRLWALAAALLPVRGSGDFNQALMELGALVCTAATPECGACPLALDCVARRCRAQTQIPARSAQRQVVRIREVAVVVRRGKRVLLVQRPSESWWAALWEFPHGRVTLPETSEAAALRLAEELTGMEVVECAELTSVRHAVTHHRITLVCFEARYRRGRFHSDYYQAGRWVKPSQLADYPFSAPQRRLAQTLVESGRTRRLLANVIARRT
jgi:A/G-specific adenine glycosylase